ncbi:hypothetical protein AK812_SmicGene18387 [Symbiodinium microadriaticum]|uniref:Uncharacterized protein n=1 Tax=Symbiodinium microadriaticum TaxID=2951 RepID=A0A1Q9DVA8_SYMMI|nr:hypothetical protein AK812_SmicGene18387 [Symbiodinium microadriaticum]
MPTTALEPVPKDSTSRQERVDSIFDVLQSVMVHYDWDAVRQDEGKILVPMTAASIMAGGVFERDDAFLKMNSKRGLLVVGTAKDWAGQQAGRLRAMLALSVRMTKRTTAARSEEMQAIKTLISEMPSFQASLQTEPVPVDDVHDADNLGEAAHVPGFTTESLDSIAEEPDEDADVAANFEEVEEDGGDPEPEEGAEVPDNSDYEVAAAHVKEERKLLDTDAVAAPQKALQAQLESMQCSEEALQVLQAQQRMKKNAREEKAAKALARSSKAKAEPAGKAKGKAKKPSPTPTDGADNEEEPSQADKASQGNTPMPSETIKTDTANEGSTPSETIETDAANKGNTPNEITETDAANKGNTREPRVPSTKHPREAPEEEAPKKKPKTTKEANQQGGCAVNWRKHGYDYGWRLAMMLAGWFEIPQGVDANDFGAVRNIISLQTAHYVATIADKEHSRDDASVSTYDIQTSALEENILTKWLPRVHNRMTKEKKKDFARGVFVPLGDLPL